MVDLKKIIGILLLCSITSCQLFSKPAIIDSENDLGTKQLTVSTNDYPPLLLSLDPEPGTTIKLRQKFNFRFSQVMDKKSVEAAFQLDPLVAGSFEWLDGKSMIFVPDQELPDGQNISLQINTNATNVAGLLLGKKINVNYQVAEPLRVGYKFPGSGEEDVDTNTNRVFLTFNQPVSISCKASFTKSLLFTMF